MDSDEEWAETVLASKPYIVRPRAALRSPLYPTLNNDDDIRIKDGPLTGVDHLHNVRNYIWNGQTKRFCGRDGAEWAKLGCYYSIFLFVLGLLFSALVIVYILLLDKKTPRRLGNESALAFDGGIHPGRRDLVHPSSTKSTFASRTGLSAAALHGPLNYPMAHVA